MAAAVRIHGVGGLAMLAGGLVAGGRVIGEWPGLSQRALHEGRDVRPTTFYESIFKSLLDEVLHLPSQTIEGSVFPDSNGLRPLQGLFRPAA